MKKNVITTTCALALVLLGGLTSCKKQYTCKCSATGLTSETTFTATNKDAQESCDKQEDDYKDDGYSDVSCTLE